MRSVTSNTHSLRRLFGLSFGLGLLLLVGVVGVLGAKGYEGREYRVFPQGNDSNCDFIAVANGIQNIGGDGGQAYWLARALVPQAVVDFKEGFYTRLGSSGSDQPFSLDNLGAAPEAFIGVYEAMGYNAVFLAAEPGTIDHGLAQTIRDRLVANPDGTFAHVWTTGGAYSPAARVFTVEATGEQVPLLYPYHEVAVMAGPDPGHVLVLDGLVGRPYPISLEDLAFQLRGFNRAIVVSRNDGSLADHQRFQLSQVGQPYVQPGLGGAYLAAARRHFGGSYQRWGGIVGPPLRVWDGQRERVVVYGAYVRYEGNAAEGVSLAPLGLELARRLEQAGVLAPEAIVPGGAPELMNGIGGWAEGEFGSREAFYRLFGRPITGEFWLSPAQMHELVLQGAPLEPGFEAEQGFIGVLTERAMLVWSAEQGTRLVPLGRLAEWLLP